LTTRIAVVAPASRLLPDVPALVQALAARLYAARIEVFFHPQCFAVSGHFAGDDATRAAAFVEVANDPAFDAVWIGRGGYGSCRMAEAALAGLNDTARRKAYLGYSDAAALLGALYGAGFAGCAHGPVAQDILRDGGEAAVGRALAWLVDRDPASLEPSLGSTGRCSMSPATPRSVGSPASGSAAAATSPRTSPSSA
jgi:muramoyltetrapeptide carboxypeptidase